MKREELEKNKGDKFYPGHHMWTYCTFLGKFTDSKGRNYDLGIYEHPRLEGMYKYSNATVFGPEEHEYSSGSLFLVTNAPNWIGNEISTEVVKRANAIGINVELQEIQAS
jgi:hypothetical protein